MDEEEEFHSFLFSEFVPMFRKAVLQNAGKTTDLDLVYCGSTNYGGGRHIIMISGLWNKSKAARSKKKILQFNVKQSNRLKRL